MPAWCSAARVIWPWLAWASAAAPGLCLSMWSRCWRSAGRPWWRCWLRAIRSTLALVHRWRAICKWANGATTRRLPPLPGSLASWAGRKSRRTAWACTPGLCKRLRLCWRLASVLSACCATALLRLSWRSGCAPPVGEKAHCGWCRMLAGQTAFCAQRWRASSYLCWRTIPQQHRLPLPLRRVAALVLCACRGAAQPLLRTTARSPKTPCGP